MTRKEDKGDQPISGETTWTTLILERHDLAENSTRQSNLEMACCYLRPTTAHYGCPMMMMMMMVMMAQIIIGVKPFGILNKNNRPCAIGLIGHTTHMTRIGNVSVAHIRVAVTSTTVSRGCTEDRMMVLHSSLYTVPCVILTSLTCISCPRLFM